MYVTQPPAVSISMAPATSVISFVSPVCTNPIHCCIELQTEPIATATPIARTGFFTELILVLRFRTQAETEMATTKWRSRENGVMLTCRSWLNSNPMPATTREQAEHVNVRPSHFGVVSSNCMFNQGSY